MQLSNQQQLSRQLRCREPTAKESREHSPLLSPASSHSRKPRGPQAPCPTASVRSPPSPPDGISLSHPCRTSLASHHPGCYNTAPYGMGPKVRLSHSSGSAPLILKTSLKAVRKEHFNKVLIKHFKRTLMVKERRGRLHVPPCSRPGLGDIYISHPGFRRGDVAGVGAVRAIPTVLRNTGVQRR